MKVKVYESKEISHMLTLIAQQSQIFNKMCRTINMTQYEGIELLLQSKLKKSDVKSKKNVTWRKAGNNIYIN